MALAIARTNINTEMRTAMKLVQKIASGTEEEKTVVKASLLETTFDAVVKGDFPKAVVYANAVFETGVSPKELLERLSSTVLNRLDEIKANEDQVSKKPTNPERLTMFGKLDPGFNIPRLKELNEAEPQFAVFSVGENLQGLVNKKDPDFLGLAGQNTDDAIESGKKPYPFEVQMLHVHSGCCATPQEH